MFTQNFKFSTCCPMFTPVHFSCKMFMNFFEWKIEVWKERKEWFFCKLNIKDGNFFLHRYIYIYIYIYIYDNNNKNIYLFIYIKKKFKKNVCAVLIKLSATTKQLITRNSICCLKNHAFFFHRVSIETGLIPPFLSPCLFSFAF